MPNHVKNRLILECPPGLVDLITTEGKLDFNRIIPTPPYVYQHSCGALEEKLFPTWYEWNRQHWGTKWGAYSQDEPQYADGKLTLRFETAWNAPHPVVLAIVQTWKVAASHAWACEGACTWGRVEYHADGSIKLADVDGEHFKRGGPDGAFVVSQESDKPTPYDVILVEVWPERAAVQEDGEDT
jgi:hypothetical protein